MFWPYSRVCLIRHSPQLALAILALIALCLVSPPGLAASTRVALLNASPELTGLAACLAARVGDSGPLVRAEALSEGLEFRMRVRAQPDAPALLVVQGLLKPDVTGLIESHNHDDDAEAQPEAARRFFHLLRIPVGTRAWVWQPERETALCGETANWIADLRSRPILFDRLEAGGDSR